MRLYVYVMEDCGGYSWERHYVLAENRLDADRFMR